MINLGISVEGQTESYFVKYSLKRYLLKYGINIAEPVILGGNVNMQRVCGTLNIMAKEYDYVTSLYDFYGFQGKNENEDCDMLIKRVFESSGAADNLIPYIQQYEFETLLFTSPEILCKQIIGTHDNYDEFMLKLKEEIQGKQPEQINDSILTAPSKRIQKIFKFYKKSLYGYIIAQEIGIEKIKESCPRFSSWVNQLIDLSLKK
jgi:hypothetical protein